MEKRPKFSEDYRYLQPSNHPTHYTKSGESSSVGYAGHEWVQGHCLFRSGQGSAGWQKSILVFPGECPAPGWGTVTPCMGVSLLYPQHLTLSKCDPITVYLLLFSVGDAHSHSSPSTPVHPPCSVQKKLKGLDLGSNLWLFSLPTWGTSVSLCHLESEGCCHCTQSQGETHCSSQDFHTTQGDQSLGLMGMTERSTSVLLLQCRSAPSFPHHREFLLCSCSVLFSLV